MKHLLYAMLIIFVTTSCNEEPDIPRDYDRKNFPDILALGNVSFLDDTDPQTLFFDQGAWFGFGLLDDAQTGFAGPYLLSSKQWAGISAFAVNLQIDGASIGFDSVKKVFYPGLLEQHFYEERITMQQQMIYPSGYEAWCKTSIRNHSSKSVAISIYEKGKLKVPPSFSEDSQRVNFRKESEDMEIRFAKKPESSSNTDSSYVVTFAQQTLAPGESIDVVNACAISPEQAAAPVPTAEQFDSHLAKNEQRWNNYLNDALATDTYMNEDSSLHAIGVKSVVTLIHNWRKAKGDLLHDGLFSSYAYRGFHGFRAWDSWKHAVALAPFQANLAKDQIRTMFDYQDENGMVAGCIYRNKDNNNYRNTMPPLSGWATYKVYSKTKDIDFLLKMYPKIKKYHQWWYEFRDHDGDSLCEYGCADGSLTAAKQESGMNNAVRFDHAQLLENGPGAYSLNQESIDLNSFLYLEKMYLANIAWLLNEEEEAITFEKEAATLQQKIAQKFYFSDDRYYYDILLDSDSAIRVKGPEAWIALYSKVSGHKEREMMGHTLYSENHFNTFVPFPSVSASHPEFDPHTGDWRGPVWFDQAYFAIQGMRQTGLWEESNEMFRKLLNNTSGLKLRSPIYENYHPESGTGLNVPHFSGSAAHLLMLHRDEK